jgi:hypothetical protein
MKTVSMIVVVTGLNVAAFGFAQQPTPTVPPAAALQVVDTVCLRVETEKCVFEAVSAAAATVNATASRADRGGYVLALPAYNISRVVRVPFTAAQTLGMLPATTIESANREIESCFAQYSGPAALINTKSDCVRDLAVRADIDALRRDITELTDKVLNKNFGPAPRAAAPPGQPASAASTGKKVK